MEVLDGRLDPRELLIDDVGEEWGVVVHPGPVPHRRRRPSRAVHRHELVLHREAEDGGARVALPTGSTAELVVHPAAVVEGGADDLKAAEVAHERRLALALRGAVLEEANRGVPERVHDGVRAANLLLPLSRRRLRSLPHRAAPQNLLRVLDSLRHERNDAVGRHRYGAVRLGGDVREAHRGLNRSLRLGGHPDGGHRVGFLRVVSLGGAHAELGKQQALEEEPGEARGVTAEHDVGTSSRHVRGDRHGVGAASLSDNLRLLRRELRAGVEELVGHPVHQLAVLGLPPVLGEEPGEVLAVLHRGGAHEHRPSLPVARHDEVRHGVPSSRRRSEHRVGFIDALVPPVRGHGDDREPVRRVELLSLGGRGAGHAG